MPQPTEIRVRKLSRVLEIAFDDGQLFELPFELLRVYSPSAEVQGHGSGQQRLEVGKRNVEVDNVEPVGHYAVQLYFSDGHSTGIYSWTYLHHLGANREALWQDYLQRLATAGESREPQVIVRQSSPKKP